MLTNLKIALWRKGIRQNPFAGPAGQGKRRDGLRPGAQGLRAESLDDLPSYACTLFNQIRPADLALEDYERVIAESNSRLYS